MVPVGALLRQEPGPVLVALWAVLSWLPLQMNHPEHSPGPRAGGSCLL